jgi:hypothetical protein
MFCWWRLSICVRLKVIGSLKTFLLAHDSYTGVVLWHSQISIYPTPVWFLSITLPLSPLSFSKWLWQLPMSHMQTCVESTRAILNPFWSSLTFYCLIIDYQISLPKKWVNIQSAVDRPLQCFLPFLVCMKPPWCTHGTCVYSHVPCFKMAEPSHSPNPTGREFLSNLCCPLTF